MLNEKIEAYCEERKQFVRGFARFVIDQGPGALTPSALEPESKDPTLTWQKRGRQIYGVRLFNQVLREELEARGKAE